MLRALPAPSLDLTFAALGDVRNHADVGDGGLGVGQAALRLLLATLAAAAIGWEREKKQRPAGLRTHMLVGLGACLFTLLALDVVHRAGGSAGDALRVVEGIVGGIGFLGAGAIMQSRGSVQGLTTAAGIWVVAAIGVTAALGNYWMLGITLALTTVTLTVLGHVESRFIHGNGSGNRDGKDRGDAAPRDRTGREDEPGERTTTPVRDDPSRRTDSG